MAVMITRREEFAMGHTLTHHKGKCYHLHGHNYVLEATFAGTPEATTGMVVDFGDIKDIMKDMIDGSFDHKFLIHRHDARATDLQDADPQGVVLTDFQPTAENLALLIKRKLGEAVAKSLLPVQVQRVVLWETSNCRAEV